MERDWTSRAKNEQCVIRIRRAAGRSFIARPSTCYIEIEFLQNAHRRVSKNTGKFSCFHRSFKQFIVQNYFWRIFPNVWTPDKQWFHFEESSFTSPCFRLPNHTKMVSRLVSVIAPFCARVLFPLTVEETCFRMRIILGVVLIRSLVFTWCVPGGLRSGSGATW